VYKIVATSVVMRFDPYSKEVIIAEEDESTRAKVEEDFIFFLHGVEYLMIGSLPEVTRQGFQEGDLENGKVFVYSHQGETTGFWREKRNAFGIYFSRAAERGIVSLHEMIN
jgi:hypothetical protein